MLKNAITTNYHESLLRTRSIIKLNLTKSKNIAFLIKNLFKITYYRHNIGNTRLFLHMKHTFYRPHFPMLCIINGSNFLRRIMLFENLQSKELFLFLNWILMCLYLKTTIINPVLYYKHFLLLNATLWTEKVK